MRVLVTGGAGYIGSHACKELKAHGCDPVVYDNLSQGHRHAVRWGPLEEGELGDYDRLGEVLRRWDVEAVIHFAALASVAESVQHPDRYYHVNVTGTVNLLRAMRAAGVDRFILSSSCAVYGHPRAERLNESHPCEPVNPYGRTKLMVEQMLGDFGMRAICLRYFNAAGADPEGELGEEHDPETHAIPLALRAARGAGTFVVNGGDYPTPDGSCVRDYVHVTDLARAHRLALERLRPGVTVCNLGTGAGYSVRQVLEKVRQLTGRALVEELGPRRPGDPASLVADPSRARELLSWRTEWSSLDQIVGTAWSWMCR